MSLVIVAPHDVDTDTDHYRCVREDMLRLGPPTIRVTEYGDDVYIALEGSHRLAIARELGIAPHIVVLDDDDCLESGYEDLPGVHTVAEIMEFVCPERQVLDAPCYEWPEIE